MTIPSSTRPYTTRSKVQLLLTPRAGLAAEDFQHLLIESSIWLNTSFSTTALPATPRVHTAFKLPVSPIAGTAHDDANNAEDSQTRNGLIELSAAASDTQQRLTELTLALLDKVKGGVDFDKSVVVAGTEHRILPGNGNFKLVFLLTRLNHLDRNGFQHYWLNDHAHFAIRQGDERIRYRQLHTDTHWVKALAKEFPGMTGDFDGSAQAYYLSMAEINDVFSNPAVAVDAYEDEKTFIDHQRSLLNFYQYSSKV